MKETMKSNLKKSMSANAKARRRTAIERLKKQLAEGTKPNKHGIVPPGVIIAPNATLTLVKKEFPVILLTQKDRERIQKEIAVLETRI